MSDHSGHSDKPVVSVILVTLVAIASYLYSEISNQQMLVFLVGAAIGITLMHAGFGFTGGWRNYILNKDSSLIRAQIILFLLCSIVMFPLVAGLIPGKVFSAALAPVSFSVLFGAFLFGIGMQLGGGCGSGTLYTFGQGQNDMLITLVFFIAGSFLGSLHLGWWTSFSNLGEISIIKQLGWTVALFVQIAVLSVLYWFFSSRDRQHNHQLKSLTAGQNGTNLFSVLIHGRWPVLWGAIILSLLAVLTMLLTGHTWSITFAFGLWGAKIWQALGGVPELSAYWSQGYPASALSSSVLYDVTSVMNFGIILGAALAAALAGKFAPSMKISSKRLLFAVCGGLLLGYGARLAFGCNIGALFAGISTGSVHAWVWLLGGIAGNIVGVSIRRYSGMDRRVVS